MKEINITYPGQILDYVDTKEHLLKLFYHITNLQEEYEKEHYLVDKLTRQLNDEYKNTEYQCKQKEDYKSRNEKAIYDLEKTKELNDRHILARDNIVIHLDIDHIEYLLNILKGDNK